LSRDLLAAKHPVAWKRLRAGLPDAPHPKTMKSACGPIVLVLDDAALHSVHDPAEEARQVVSRADISEAAQIMVFGFGAGHVLRETLRCAGSDARITAVILDPGAFLVTLGGIDCNDLLADPRLDLALGSLREIVAMLPAADESLRVVVHPPLLAATAPSLAPLAQMARELATTQSSRLDHFATILENIERNLSVIMRCECASALRREIAGKSVLLVAPGPSLDEQLETLAQARRPLLCAVDTALRVLEDAGIEADLALTVDPTKKNLAKFVGLKDDIPLVFFEGARPEIVARSHRPLFACERKGLLDRAHPFFGRGGRFESRGSSLTAALDLLLAFDPATIGLIGADFALKEGRSYAGTAGDTSSGRLRELPGRDGGLVATTEILWLHRRRLLRRLEGVRHDAVVDLRSDGAELPGLARGELADWLVSLDDASRDTRIKLDAPGSESANHIAAEHAARKALHEAREAAARRASTSRLPDDMRSR